MMDVAKLEEQLHIEGFRHTYVWQDGPHANYPDHTHAAETAHIILEGELTLIVEAAARRTVPATAATFPPAPLCTPRGWSRGLPLPHWREVAAASPRSSSSSTCNTCWRVP